MIPVSFYLVKTRLSESEQKVKSKPVTILDSESSDRLALPIKLLFQNRNRKKWKRFDSSHSDSVELITPL